MLKQWKLFFFFGAVVLAVFLWPKDQKVQAPRIIEVTPQWDYVKKIDPNVNGIAAFLYDKRFQMRLLYRSSSGNYLTGGIETAEKKRYDFDWFEKENLLVIRTDKGGEFRLRLNGELEGSDQSGESLKTAHLAMRDILSHFGEPYFPYPEKQ